jgi:hypothetical protein
VAVPETSIDKYNFATAGKHHVRLSGQILPVNPKAISHTMEQTSNFYLGSSILARDRTHIHGALLRRQFVYQS